MQFLTDKLIVFPLCSEDHKIHTFTDPTLFLQTFRALNSWSHFPQTFKDLQRPCEPWQSKAAYETYPSLPSVPGQNSLRSFCRSWWPWEQCRHQGWDLGNTQNVQQSNRHSQCTTNNNNILYWSQWAIKADIRSYTHIHTLRHTPPFSQSACTNTYL